jgi:(p)ppGpp synthase/HD superfamily hydrolase
MNNTEFKKLRSSLRYWLLGKSENNADFHKVIIALQLAEKYHTGKRKGGEPTMIHQLTIMGLARTLLPWFIDPVAVLIVCLLHDLYEDHPETADEIARLFPEYFDMIVRISKYRDGKLIPYKQYFDEIAACPVCSIVKMIDRIHNVSTMVGVFTYEKQTEYIEEVNLWFLPMVKSARFTFSAQEGAYENLKSFLLVQRDTILATRVDTAKELQA